MVEALKNFNQQIRRRGETVDRLYGVIGELDMKEEAELLRPGLNDFSVMYSTRLGPIMWSNKLFSEKSVLNFG